jgi:hypothetical protein
MAYQIVLELHFSHGAAIGAALLMLIGKPWVTAHLPVKRTGKENQALWGIST